MTIIKKIASVAEKVEVSGNQKDICILIFFAALFIRAKIKKYSVRQWING